MAAAAPDVGALSRVVADAIAARVAERLGAAGFGDVRDPHRTAVEGLVAGDTTVTQLAARAGVSAQAVSKTVAELERAGYVSRTRDPGDQRARPLALTARGRELIEAGRRARRAVARDLERWLGTRDTAELVRLLQHAVERFDERASDARS